MARKESLREAVYGNGFRGDQINLCSRKLPTPENPRIRGSRGANGTGEGRANRGEKAQVVAGTEGQPRWSFLSVK